MYIMRTCLTLPRVLNPCLRGLRFSMFLLTDFILGKADKSFIMPHGWCLMLVPMNQLLLGTCKG